jgi:YfiH family protein
VSAIALTEPFAPWGEHIAVRLPGAGALFTTRRGGVSAGPYKSLNLGRLTGDAAEAVRRNRQLLEDLVGLPLAMIRQMHGTRVKRLQQAADVTPPGAQLEEADGQALAIGGTAAMVLAADCLPIVVAGGGAAAILHAGWRGLASGIVEAGVGAVRELGARGELQAAIGPGAGPCCYQVSDEVHRCFAAYGAGARRGSNLDLKAVAVAQLQDCGVQRVHDVGLCTICEPSLFFSHRRDRGVTGRQAGLAWLRGGTAAGMRGTCG